jgi:ubiquitin C-terminal hydrolase
VFHPSDLADQSFQCNGLSINADRHLSGKQYGYTSPTVQLFTGQQHGEIVCQCGAISNRFEVFRTIELPISGSNVRDCLNKYTDIDVLPDYACDSCGQKCMAANRVTFWRLPPILTFAIKRTVYHQTGRPTKDNTILQAPDMLELQSFMTRGEAQPYKLFAIANHSGDANFGHCYTTLKTDGVWYILNDHQITPLSHRSDSPNDYIYWYARGDAT